MTKTEDSRPRTFLIAALGGEGGGVLSEWLTAAAGAEGFPVQATSIPGVAQRTGATTYYIEIFPKRWSELGAARPVLALSPTQANVDVMVATEFLEAARAIENGWVTPDRTVLIASNHRTYSILERSAMSDGRYDSSRIYNAIRARAQCAVVFDMEEAARAAGSMLSPVVLGAIARSAGLPVRRGTFEQVIRASGIAVDANLRGFAIGFERAHGVFEPATAKVEIASPAIIPQHDLLGRLDSDIPAEARSLVRHGLERVIDYQGHSYGQLYLDRLKPLLALDSAAHMWTLTAETARFLALRMSYEDIIRVADLKTRSERTSRVRREVGAKPEEPVVITEFLKPGLEEVTAMLPPSIGRRLMEAAIRRNWHDRLNVGIYLKTSKVSGFLILWTLGRLRRWRPRTWRYSEEQANIVRWLDAVHQAGQIDYQFGVETARCANLVKGYGSTHRRGTENFSRIMEGIIWPSIQNASGRAADVARLREAALKDPEGAALEQAFSEFGLSSPQQRVSSGNSSQPLNLLLR